MESRGLVTTETAHRRAWPRMVRHFLEMVAAMWAGMAVGGLIATPILGVLEMTPAEARVRYPELSMFVMAFAMTVPMVVWMRHRGHGWRSCLEMSAAMVLPGFFLLCLFWAGATAGPACGAYCALMIGAMLAVMVYRRDEYSESHRHHEQANSVVEVHDRSIAA